MKISVILAASTWAATGTAAPPRPDIVVARAVRGAVGADEQVRFAAARRDLNGDGRAEIVAYVAGARLCGSGGCPMFVLTPSGQGYRTVTKTSVTQLPVRVLPARHHGWLDLAVGVRGGGARARLARLTFDGRSYPRNPTVVGAAAQRSAGSALLGDQAALTPLPR